MAERKITSAGESDGIVTLKFSNDAKVSLDLDELCDEIRHRALVHGIIQKLSDAGSGLGINDAVTASSKVADQLLAGSWKTHREPGTSVSALDKLTAAVVAVRAAAGVQLDPDKVRSMLDGMDKKARRGVRTSPEVRAWFDSQKPAPDADPLAAFSD